MKHDLPVSAEVCVEFDGEFHDDVTFTGCLRTDGTMEMIDTYAWMDFSFGDLDDENQAKVLDALYQDAEVEMR